MNLNEIHHSPLLACGLGVGFLYLTQARTAISVNLFNVVTYLASCNEAMISCGELTCSPIYSRSTAQNQQLA
ncbi:MAG: hypothetical protein EA343_05685 [Nodularia sp. (in: Bacteria)]|nr:MAG: hypothetical protein EA343_05685 [Nodularia sp. (in: cyanobacteria)]